jgi:hypothetical protein
MKRIHGNIDNDYNNNTRPARWKAYQELGKILKKTLTWMATGNGMWKEE